MPAVGSGVESGDAAGAAALGDGDGDGDAAASVGEGIMSTVSCDC